MRFIVLAFLFFCSLFGEAIVIDKPIEQKTYIGQDSLIYVDKEKIYTLDNIISIQNKFIPVTNTAIGYMDANVWSYFEIKNNINIPQTLYFKNPYQMIRIIDVLVIKNGITTKHFLGALRDQSIKEIPSRFSVFKLSLQPNESAQIFIRHESISTINIDWLLFDHKLFFKNIFIEDTIYGIFMGTVLAFIVYSMALYHTFREVSFVYYALFGIGNLIMQFSLVGIFYMSEILSPINATTLSSIFIFFTYITLSLFAVSFFKLKKHSPLLYKTYIFLVMVGIVMMFSNYPRFYNELPFVDMSIQNKLYFLYFAIFLVTGIFVTRKKLVGGIYFLIGISILVGTYAVASLNLIGITNLKIEFAYYALFAIISDMTFISLAISQKVLQLKKEKEQTQEMLLEHAKYKNIGTLMAEVVHQLKTPIVQVGSLSSNIAMIFDMKRDKFTPAEHAKIEQLENNIGFMSETINRLYDSYKSDAKNIKIEINELVLEILELFEKKINSPKIEISYTQRTYHVTTSPQAIKHILLVILENAIDIIEERKTKKPKITIETKIEKTNFIIDVFDNAGGIDEKKIDDIFKMHQSFKSKKGLGLGLALAKSLCENRLNGYIQATNDSDGARFTVSFPYDDR